MLFLIIFLWLIPSLEVPPATESLVFQIIHNDENVGELKAEKRNKGSVTEYENTTTLRTRIITNVEISYFTKVVFADGILQSSDVTIKVNGKTYSHTQTQRSGNQYQFFKDDKLKKTIDGPISYSSVMLLFGEPRGHQSCLLRRGGRFPRHRACRWFCLPETQCQGQGEHLPLPKSGAATCGHRRWLGRVRNGPAGMNRSVFET